MVRYRRDIDGLRALAVVPVVLFHAGLPIFSGGFIGVDIFFVISGYLITQQLLTADASGWRSIADFYERRVRRIAPAFLVLLLTLLVATLALMPAVDTLRNAKNILAALFFAANVRFYSKTGYFGGAADDEPLLHTWSLAVEEQYYLIFPLLLLFLRWAGARSIVPVFAVLALVSLILSEAILASQPTFAFYLLPARGWELLAGALLAAGAAPVIGRARGRELLSAVGLLLIVVPMFAYDRFTPFPGMAALSPVVGAALLIATAEGTRVGRLLSNRLLVAIGLISYSLYLWHWPIFVMSRQVLGRPDAVGTALLIVASFLAAFLSYRYVERPFRNRTKVTPRRLLVLTGAAAAVVAAGAVALIGSGGWPARSPAADDWHRSTAQVEQAFQTNPCLTHGDALPPPGPCRLGSPGSLFSGVLWGDSHAAHWATMVDAAGSRTGLSFRQLTKAGCPPVPTKLLLPADSDRKGCPAFNARVVDLIIADPTIRYVVLAANWQGVAEGDIRVADDGQAPRLAESRATASRTLAALAARLRSNGKVVVAIGQTPIPDENVVLCIGRRLAIGLATTSCARSSVRLAQQRDAAARSLLAGVAGPSGSHLLSPLRRFCDSSFCVAIENGKSLYIDAAHLSPLGARRLEQDFAHLLTSPSRQESE